MPKTLSFEELVTACYRALLRREPENRDVVRDRAAQIDRPEDIITTFLQSAEHQAMMNDGLAPIDLAENYGYDALPIETDVPAATLQTMFTRIAEEWEEMGETDPHWSVLTAEQYRSANIQENLDAFYASGQPNVTWMQNIARRNGITLGAGQTCFELGCGVGRVTLPLSDLFDHVTGFDISSGNLAEARAVVDARGKSNITLTQMKQIKDIHAAPDFDVLFTIIVLQHNPPPVQKYILDALLGKLRPGGVAYFQLPTYLPGYSFDAKRYLADDARGMEMHAVPMREVIAMLADHGLTLVEIIQDNFTGMPGSHSFLAVKSGG